MTEFIKQITQEYGDAAEIVPIEWLHMLKQDVDDLKNDDSLNDFIMARIKGEYDDILTLPKIEFVVRSIIIVASKSSLAEVIFNHNGKRIPLQLPPGYVHYISKPAFIEDNLTKTLSPHGYHVKRIERLPLKILAVRSGLCVYGRNNICFREDMGSFLGLFAYLSDIPCESGEWHPLRRMDSCETCRICERNCPTGAIKEEKVIISSDRCLTRFSYNRNELPDGMELPDYLYGCMKCQECCPHNHRYLGNVIESEEFTEEETRILLQGTPFESLTKELGQKLRTTGMQCWFGALQCNLGPLLDKLQGAY